MIPPNRLEISAKVRATGLGDRFAVSFPYDEAAVRLARSGPGSIWDRGMKSWMMKGGDIARVLEVMHQIHDALVAAGKDTAEECNPRAWVDWGLVPSRLVLHDDPDLVEGALVRLRYENVVIEKIGDPYTYDCGEGLVDRGLIGKTVCRCWHRKATDMEVRVHFEKIADNDGPEM